jgi:hypothetical protein
MDRPKNTMTLMSAKTFLTESEGTLKGIGIAVLEKGEPMPKLIEGQAAKEKGESMSREQAEIIMAFAKNDMQLKAAGKELYMTGATVAYHLTKIRKQMGWNPRKFFDLCFLVGVAAQRIGGKHE